MKIPKIVITPAILTSLTDIEIHISRLKDQQIPIHISAHLDNKNIMQSALYSARIEGNTLDEDALDNDGDDLAKKEVFGLLDGTNYIKALPERQLLTETEIKKIHKIIMKDIAQDAGLYRVTQNAIFDASGTVRYLPPPVASMKKDLQELVTYANTQVEYPLLTALLVHLLFEKIHPFVDGNGRVGRLLVSYLMKSYGKPFPQVVPFERYLENNRSLYYRYLDIGLTDIESYLLFMLDAIKHELQKVAEELKILGITPTKIMLLSARQQAVYELIKDQKYISMDSIWRRFRKVSVRNLRHDVSVLLKKKLIRKHGTTRGAVYEGIR